MRQRSDLDSVVETILVDAYGDDEQYVAFLTVIKEETRLPAAATLLGAPVTVTGLDYTNGPAAWSRSARGPTAPAR
jgi:hypothetical protein